MSNNINLNDNNWIEIVFQNRNKEYGAYQIRKNYNRNSVLGIIGMFSFLGLAFGVIVLFSSFKSAFIDKPDITIPQDTFYIFMPEMEPIEEEPIVEETVEPAVPDLSKTIAFVEPTIVPDNKVPDDLLPPTEKELEGTTISTTTIPEGANGENIIPSESTNGNGSGTGLIPEVGVYAEKMPEFPGGHSALIHYISERSKFTPLAKENNISGTIYVSFIVNEQGEVINPKIERGIGFGMDEMVLNVVKNLPNFSPAEQNGRKVKIKMMLPIKYELK